MSDHITYDTPECLMCGTAAIPLMEDAYVLLRGAFLQSKEYDTPIFVLSPDTKMRIIELPNGQLALITDSFGGPTRHSCTSCMHDAAYQLGAAGPIDPEDDERFENEPDDFMRYR